MAARGGGRSRPGGMGGRVPHALSLTAAGGVKEGPPAAAAAHACCWWVMYVTPLTHNHPPPTCRMNTTVGNTALSALVIASPARKGPSQMSSSTSS
jgi:hypothetical protein